MVHKAKHSDSEESNHLIDEKSPYLLQHAQNPVDWYPWGEEAFEKAKEEDKPIFLSIGYSTCHWCHVMAHESFEDEQVAKRMNEVFVSIKVDREERPDLDNIYMTVCQMMTRSGGWPLTIIMTPERKPFFAGTYFPKTSRFGRIGLLDLITRIETLWKTERSELLGSAEQIVAALQTASTDNPGEKLDKRTLEKTYEELKGRFDKKKAGFNLAPKFPTPHNLLFLLRYWRRTGEEYALEMVTRTLDEMRRGGIYDHIGYGFHRYSTDRDWLLPHFEKMLYDNALLAFAYTEAYQATHQENYKNTVEQILRYIERDMTSPEGGFYSAEDADSEGVEGKFYVWSEEEIAEILDDADLKIAKEVFTINKEGNYEDEATRRKTGKNILHMEVSLDKTAEKLDISLDQLHEKEKSIRKSLQEVRKKRIRPHLDDKILTDWNGLMIAAYAKGGFTFSNKKYIRIARKTADFILSTFITSEGRLLHRYKDGKAEINAYIDDYAFLIWGLIELYEATRSVEYLKSAIQLNEDLLEHFWDNDVGGFYFTPDDGENLLMRKKEIYDGAIPSGNSVAMLNLLRLSQITGETEYMEKADYLSRVFADSIRSNPSAYTMMMSAIDFAVGPSYTLVIAGDSNAQDTEEMIERIKSVFLPNKTILYRETDQSPPDIQEIAQFTEFFNKYKEKATAYVCVNKTCKPAINNPDKMLEVLDPSWE